MSRYFCIRRSLMKCQMIRVISSPSSSTTVPCTLILPIGSPRTLAAQNTLTSNYLSSLTPAPRSAKTATVLLTELSSSTSRRGPVHDHVRAGCGVLRGRDRGLLRHPVRRPALPPGAALAFLRALDPHVLVDRHPHPYVPRHGHDLVGHVDALDDHRCAGHHQLLTGLLAGPVPALVRGGAVPEHGFVDLGDEPLVLPQRTSRAGHVVPMDDVTTQRLRQPRGEGRLARAAQPVDADERGPTSRYALGEQLADGLDGVRHTPISAQASERAPPVLDHERSGQRGEVQRAGHHEVLLRAGQEQLEALSGRPY